MDLALIFGWCLSKFKESAMLVHDGGSQRQRLGGGSTLEDSVLFGPLRRAKYLEYAPSSPNDPEYAVRQVTDRFSKLPDDRNATARADRERMFENYKELLESLNSSQGAPLLHRVYHFISTKSGLAQKELAQERSGLGLHLREITDFCRAFYQTQDGASRFPDLLNDRQAALLAQLAAPLHDVLKYLGSYQSQIMPDHEVLTAELVRQKFTGGTVMLNEKETTLTKEDVEFVASVIGDHENINKEEGRSEWVNSSNPIERAKALFFVADVLTGVIVERPAASGLWGMDPEQFEERFVDLYFRHIDLNKGKIFRPEWGLKAIADLSTTLDTLVEKGCDILGSNRTETTRETLVKGALQAIDRAIAADDVCRGATTSENDAARESRILNNEQCERIGKVQQQLEEMLK
jgi:hypothetical protein